MNKELIEQRIRKGGANAIAGDDSSRKDDSESS